MANPATPHFGIWRLFIDECHTKSNDFYEIDDINIFGAGLYIRKPNEICKKLNIDAKLYFAHYKYGVISHQKRWLCTVKWAEYTRIACVSYCGV